MEKCPKCNTPIGYNFFFHRYICSCRYNLDEPKMTPQEAISRIREHMVVHHIGEYPHIELAEALNMAITALMNMEEVE